MAPPDLLEWVPTSSSVNPNFSSPKYFTADRILWSIMVEGIVESLTLWITVLILRFGTWVEGMPSLYNEDTNSAAARTGHIILLPIESLERW
jgi:hypothetical protein